ncbi:hypothetical protein BU198_04905 [Streptomyces sp. CBMA156]|nr:hypothetical protein [Streptomyces sp. CBMA156]
MPWSPTTLVTVDTAYDTENTSNTGGSRFASYVRQYEKDFQPWDEDDVDPVRFAAAAWGIATGPVMSPGYVRTRPDLHSVTAFRDDYDGPLVFKITVPLRHHQLAGPRLPYEWADWETDRFQYGNEGFKSLVGPDPQHTRGPVSVLTTTTVLYRATDWKLPAAARFTGPGLADDATEAVHALVEHLNRDAGPIVARLLGAQG